MASAADSILKPISLLVFLLMISFSSSSTLSPYPIAKPGCEDHCGNVSIPYPFGITEGCFLDEGFHIECINSSSDAQVVDPPRPVLVGSTIFVKDISLGGQLRVMYDVAYDCYVNSTQNYWDKWMTLAPPKVFNSTANKFTAIGCDTYAEVKGNSDNGSTVNERTYTTGCMSVCGYEEDVEDGACSGIGCCQTSIPYGVWNMSVSLSSYNKHSYVLGFNPCSYGFVIEESAFKFFAQNLTNFTSTSVPVVVDWVAAYETCEVAVKNLTAYACKAKNSLCEDPDGALGYRCICKEGFDGNPYLSANGCQDINECEDSTLNNCASNSTCTNTFGSYTCSCNSGYYGDGKKDGIGCIAIVPPPKKTYWPIYTGLAAGFGMLCFMIGVFMLYKMLKRWHKKKQKEKFFKLNGGLLLQQQISSDEGVVEKTKIFSAKELKKASDGFNPNRVLGEGGQGTVYKGMLTDGRTVAIKKSKKVGKSQLEEFINEVIILSQVNHRNVVKLLGCCLEAEVPLLVYEFISNGTLFDLIHNDSDKEFPLTWTIRLKIAMEVANALAYLHSSISTPIYHKDIKSSNILLDGSHIAKVSDFGTSRSVAIDQTHLTTRVQGTFGYMDPEYFQSSQFTDKSDVYSFGVVLIELLTRQKPILAQQGENHNSGLASRFLECMEKSCLKVILDPEIVNEENEEQVYAVAKLAQRCVNLNGRRRPSMREVAIELENIKMSNLDSTVPANSPSRKNYIEEEFSGRWTFGIEILASESHTFPLLSDTF